MSAPTEASDTTGPQFGASTPAVHISQFELNAEKKNTADHLSIGCQKSSSLDLQRRVLVDFARLRMKGAVDSITLGTMFFVLFVTIQGDLSTEARGHYYSVPCNIASGSALQSPNLNLFHVSRSTGKKAALSVRKFKGADNQLVWSIHSLSQMKGRHLNHLEPKRFSR